jgi:hypothetical protein
MSDSHDLRVRLLEKADRLEKSSIAFTGGIVALLREAGAAGKLPSIELLRIIREWKRGCSCASDGQPEDCHSCTRAAMDAIERVVAATPIPDSAAHDGGEASASWVNTLIAVAKDINRYGLDDNLSDRLAAALATPIADASKPGNAEQTLQAICDLFGIGIDARQPTTILTNIKNVKRFADYLQAIEREFFMVPGEPDEDYPDDEPEPECLLNRWGSSKEEYVEQFRSALAALSSPRADVIVPDVATLAGVLWCDYLTNDQVNSLARDMHGWLTAYFAMRSTETRADVGG